VGWCSRAFGLRSVSRERTGTSNNQKAILRVVPEMAFALQASQITPGAGGRGPLVPYVKARV